MNAKKSSHRSHPHLTVTPPRKCPPTQPTGKYAAKPIVTETQQERQPDWRFPKRRTPSPSSSSEQPRMQF